MLIGQRGNDILASGLGNDLLIGDAGTNLIASNADFPRVYQIFRSMQTPWPYAQDATDFGMTFMSDFDLYPNPYRFVDSLMSIIGECIMSRIHKPANYSHCLNFIYLNNLQIKH